MTIIEIEYQVDNQKWTDEEFDNNTDRKIVIDEHQFFEYLKFTRNVLGEDEYIHDILKVEIKH